MCSASFAKVPPSWAPANNLAPVSLLACPAPASDNTTTPPTEVPGGVPHSTRSRPWRPTMSTAPRTADANSPSRHALGLPAGSVRALLAFGALIYLWILVLSPGRDGEGPLAAREASQAFIYLQFLMVLILAHYFTAHGRSI